MKLKSIYLNFKPNLNFYIIYRVEEADIEEQIVKLRAKLSARLEERLANMKDDVLAEKKDIEMKRLQSAFGIDKDHKEGRGFRFETEKTRQERLARIEEEERLHKKIRKY